LGLILDKLKRKKCVGSFNDYIWYRFDSKNFKIRKTVNIKIILNLKNWNFAPFLFMYLKVCFSIFELNFTEIFGLCTQIYIKTWQKLVKGIKIYNVKPKIYNFTEKDGSLKGWKMEVPCFKYFEKYSIFRN